MQTFFPTLAVLKKVGTRREVIQAEETLSDYGRHLSLSKFVDLIKKKKSYPGNSVVIRGSVVLQNIITHKKPLV